MRPLQNHNTPFLFYMIEEVNNKVCPSFSIDMTERLLIDHRKQPMLKIRASNFEFLKHVHLTPLGRKADLSGLRTNLHIIVT